MARPIAANAAATRARILVAAGDAFARGGREGGSIRQIASAANVSLAMIHHYFGSKDGLYDACIEAMYTELKPLQERLLGSVLAGQPLSAIIPEAVRHGFRFARSHQAPSRLLFRQITLAGQLAPEHVEAQQRPFLDGTSRALALALDRAPDSMRLPLQSAVVLVARYGISSLAELEIFTGTRAEDTSPEHVESIVEDHLVDAVLTLLAIPTENS